MTKPTRVPLWDVNQINLLAPSSALVDNGYPNNDVPTAGNFNYQLYWLGQWAAYLDAGTLDSNINITGDLTVGGSVEVAENIQIDGNASVDGGVTVYGAVTAETVTATDSVTAPELHFTVPIGTPIPVSASLDPNNTHTRNAGGNAWILGSSANKIIYPISGVPAGATITGWTINVAKYSNNTHTMTARLYRCHADGTEIQLGSDVSTSANAPGGVALSATGLTQATDDLHQYYLAIRPDATATGDFANHAVVYWTW